jgi:hypothetical protein
VGSKSLIEAAKAASMRAIIPARQRAGLLVKSAKRIGRPRMERAVADRPPV